MMRLTGINLACVLLLSAVCDGAVAGEDKTINMLGHGVEPCRAWLESRKDGHSVGYGDLLLGYLSGVNLWGPTGGRDLLRNRTGQEMVEWIDGSPASFASGSQRQLIWTSPDRTLGMALASVPSLPGGAAKFINELVLPAEAALPAGAVCVGRLDQ